MHLGCAHQPHVAVDARSGVPSRVELLSVIHAHGHGVALFPETGRHVVEERGEAARALAQQLSVDVHLGVVIHAFEVDVVASSGRQFAVGDAQSVPGHAAAQIALTRAFVGRHGQLHAPVVWQVHPAPLLVVEVSLPHLGPLADVPCAVHAQEAPSFVDFLGVSEGHLCLHSRCCCEHGEERGE